MSLPGIGAQCSLDSCNLNDFLPIRCRCDQVFCKDHISPEAHKCPLIDTSYVPTQSSTPLQRCAAKDCNKPSLEAFISNSQNTDGRTPAVCDKCKQAFCATHREPASHACATLDANSEVSAPKNEAGRALLAKLFPKPPTQVPASMSTDGEQSTAAKQKAVLPSNPKKAAQMRQVELMKMRHRAQPGDPKDKGKNVPVGERLHVKVRMEGKDEDQRVLWFRKTMIAGKALDLLATQFGVSQASNLRLVRVDADDSDSTDFENSRPMGEQIEDASSLELRRTFA